MIFLATHWKGIARAEGDEQHGWQVTQLLPQQRINCFAVDPFDGNKVYAGSEGHGVLCSPDRGQTWHPLGPQGFSIRSLAPSPHEPDVLYAGMKPASVYVSRDGGNRWQELSGFRRVRRWYWFSPAEPPSLTPYVQGLTVSPADPDVIVAGIEAGAVVRSEDGGQTWAGHLKGADRDCHSLGFHPSDGDWVYEGGGGGPAVSRDGGRTWQHPTEGLKGRYCWASAADPERPEVWYVSASGFSWRGFMPQAHRDGDAGAFIYRSSGGAAWEKLDGGLPQPLDYMAYALLTDLAEPGHLYAGLANGHVWHSDDYGDSWRRLTVDLGAIQRSMIMI